MENLKKAIELLTEEIKEKQAEMDSFELDKADCEESYIEALDSEGVVNVAGMHFYPSRILSELDPIAYSCGLNDYVDSMDKSENLTYKAMEKELEELTDRLADLEIELEELELNEREEQYNLVHFNEKEM